MDADRSDYLGDDLRDAQHLRASSPKLPLSCDDDTMLESTTAEHPSQRAVLCGEGDQHRNGGGRIAKLGDMISRPRTVRPTN